MARIEGDWVNRPYLRIALPQNRCIILEQESASYFSKLKRLYIALSAAVLILGVVHMLFTLRLESTSPAGKIWFFGAGIAMAQTGLFNMLNARYGRDARGLYIVTVLTNFAMTAFAFIAGRLTGGTTAEVVVIVGVLAATTFLSIFAPRKTQIQ